MESSRAECRRVGADTRYPSRSAQERTNRTANARGILDFGHDKFGLSVTHLNLMQLRNDLGAVPSSARIPYQVDEGALSYIAKTHSLWSFIGGTGITHYQFEDNAGM